MKYIALDIGNVLCTVAAAPFLENLSETFNVTIPEANRFLKRFQQIHDLGYTTMEDELKDKFGAKSPVTIKRLVDAWNESVTPCIPMIEKLNELREKNNLQVALLSNIGVEHAAMMEQKLNHGGFFPGAIKHFSCYVGARKPSMVYYQSFLMQYPKFKGCLYVDDLQENLNASEQFGFKTFHMSLELPGVDGQILEIERILTEEKPPEKNRRWH
jgi:FMN phosphatase YigB (HAD superfamily)